MRTFIRQWLPLLLLLPISVGASEDAKEAVSPNRVWAMLPEELLTSTMPKQHVVVVVAFSGEYPEAVPDTVWSAVKNLAEGGAQIHALDACKMRTDVSVRRSEIQVIGPVNNLTCEIPALETQKRPKKKQGMHLGCSGPEHDPQDSALQQLQGLSRACTALLPERQMKLEQVDELLRTYVVRQQQRDCQPNLNALLWYLARGNGFSEESSSSAVEEAEPLEVFVFTDVAPTAAGLPQAHLPPLHMTVFDYGIPSRQANGWRSYIAQHPEVLTLQWQLVTEKGVVEQAAAAPGPSEPGPTRHQQSAPAKKKPAQKPVRTLPPMYKDWKFK